MSNYRSERRAVACAFVVLAGLASPFAHADESRVSQSPGMNRFPEIAASPSGAHVVVWDSNTNDGNDSDVRLQRYDAAGNKVGSETIANFARQYNQFFPSVAMFADGSFLVVWIGAGLQGGNDAWARRFSASGEPLDPIEFKLNDTPSPGIFAKAAATPDGRVIVAWEQSDPATFGQRLSARIVDAAGSLGPEFRVNEGDAYTQNPHVVVNAARNEVLFTWNAPVEDRPAVFGRLFDLTGQPKTGDIRISSNEDWNSYPSAAAFPDGYAVTWYRYGWNGDVALRWLGADGTPGAPEVTVAQSTRHEFDPSLGQGADGTTVLVFAAQEESTEGYSIFLQRIGTDGQPQGDAERVNGSTGDYDSAPAVAVRPADAFIVIWEKQVESDASPAMDVMVRHYETRADLVASLSDSPDPVHTGGQITYTVGATNNSAISVADIAATLTLPASVTVVAVNAPEWTCAGANTLECHYAGPLAAHGTAEFTVTARAPDQATTLTASASVTSPLDDPAPGNNSVTQTTAVQSCVVTDYTSPDPGSVHYKVQTPGGKKVQVIVDDGNCVQQNVQIKLH